MKKWKNRNAKYWRERAIREEASKEARATRLSRATRKAYRDSVKRLEAELNALLVDILSRDGQEITRTELYRMERYKALREKVSKELRELAISDNDALEDFLSSLATRTYASNMKAFGLEFTIVAKKQVESIVQNDWTAVHFSKRIWGNADSFNQRILSDLEDMIINGKSPDAIKKKLIEDYSAHYHEADRLIRTEASHVYNESALQSYKDAGCTHIEFLAEADCCDKCEPYSGNIYHVEDVPTIPVHPNCRCTYLPVIE